MSTDFEKNRAEYVVLLEQRLQHALAQVAEAKTQEKWIPKVSSEIDGANMRVTMAFGGKISSVAVPIGTVAANRVEDLTIAVVDQLYHQLICDQLRPVVEPQVARVKQNIDSRGGK